MSCLDTQTQEATVAIAPRPVVQQDLKRLIERARLVSSDAELSPGDRFTAAIVNLPPAAQAPTAVITAGVAWSVLSEPDGGALVPGGAFLAPRGLAAGQVELLFRPEVVERLAPPAAPLRRLVRATLTLTAADLDGPVSVSREFELEVQVLPLRIPSLLALFRHRSFAFRRAGDPQDGAALVIAPANSPLSGLDGATAALTALRGQVERLTGFARLAALATGLRELTGALAEHPADHVAFRRTDEIANLNHITLVDRAFLANDIEAEDEFSSLILLGPAARRVRCFVRRNLDPAAGRLDVTVGDENVVLIRTLHTQQPRALPAGAATVVVTPPGDRTFGDELSSLQLLPPSLLSTLTGRATLVVDSPLAGRDTAEISVVLAFSDDHRTYTVDSFPPIQGEAATITLADDATGTFDPGSGAATLDVRLRLATLLGPLEVTFELATSAPLDPDSGAITLVGESRLEGSALNPADDPLAGKAASVVIEGELDPIP